MAKDLRLEEMLQRADPLSGGAHAKDLRALIAGKIEDLRYYDVPNMDRAVAVCHWGRSGSNLVASYLDGHDEVVMLPTDRSQEIYGFFERDRSLCLRDKLIAYSISADFFQGDFSITAENYYAAVAAICEVYDDYPPRLLETRRAFFQFLHVAYSLALDRRPACLHPLMVYAQHSWNDGLAQRFVEDFPEARFLHTVRDPITTFDRTFEHWSKFNSGQVSWITDYLRSTLNIFGSALNSGQASWVIHYLAKADEPHPGMKSRTLAIRFEDLHNNTEETMSRLLDWLSLPYHIAVSKSTFNGMPFVVERSGNSWSGPRPEQALRSSRNVSLIDRTLLFALFHENFVAWNYSCPTIFANALIRGLTFMVVLPIPMEAEIARAWATLKVDVVPSLGRGNLYFAFKCLVRIFRWRLSMMRLLVAEFCGRLFFGKAVLEII